MLVLFCQYPAVWQRKIRTKKKKNDEPKCICIWMKTLLQWHFPHFFKQTLMDYDHFQHKKLLSKFKYVEAKIKIVRQNTLLRIPDYHQWLQWVVTEKAGSHIFCWSCGQGCECKVQWCYQHCNKTRWHQRFWGETNISLLSCFGEHRYK